MKYIQEFNILVKREKSKYPSIKFFLPYSIRFRIQNRSDLLVKRTGQTINTIEFQFETENRMDGQRITPGKNGLSREKRISYLRNRG